jgi:type IV pilus assembly protein PilC
LKKYKYKAKKGPQEIVEGMLLAESQDEAIDQINNMGLLPMDLYEEGAETKQPVTEKKISLRVKIKFLTAFYRQLKSLVKSGVSILKALNLLSDQFSDSKLRNIIGQVKDGVREGQDLSESLGRFPSVFGRFEIAMINAGESVGHLDEALSHIVQYREQIEDVQSKIKSAIAYPIFLLCVAFVSVVFMLTYVIPKFSSFFTDLGQELPLATRILIEVSGWFESYGLYFMAALVVLFVFLSKASKNETNRIILDRMWLKIPKFGALTLNAELSQLCRALQLLVGSGMQLPIAMKIGKGVVQNSVIKNGFETSCRVVSDGGSFSEALLRPGVFPSLMVQLAHAGEETGKLDDALGQVASWYEKDVEVTIKMMTSLLEPIIILGVGIIMGAIVISVLLPVFSLSAVTP